MSRWTLAFTLLLMFAGTVEARQQTRTQSHPPKRFAPPVHAKPLPQSQSRPQAANAERRTRFPIRQVANVQNFQDDQWRTRTRTSPSVMPVHQDGLPALVHPSPQQNSPSQWSTTDGQSSWQTQDQQNAQIGQQEFRAPRLNNPSSEFNDGRPPAIEDFEDEPFMSSRDGAPASQGTQGHSVLMRDHPLREQTTAREPETSDNSLRDLRVEPRRANDGRLNRENTLQSRYRRPQESEQYYPDNGMATPGNQLRDVKSCEDYRQKLLNKPITDIVLDFAPLRPAVAARNIPEGMTRTWTDCNGNPLGTGTLTGLERSYVLIENETGTYRIPMTQLSDSDLLVVTEFWALPTECSLGCYPFEGRNWACNTMFWKASSLCHKPLFFENIQLERYGHTHGPVVQPFHSTAHFFTSLILWPYNAGIHPPNECQYALGYYRPGDCAPWLKDPFPFSLHGAIRQGAAVGGAVAIIP